MHPGGRRGSGDTGRRATKIFQRFYRGRITSRKKAWARPVPGREILRKEDGYIKVGPDTEKERFSDISGNR